MGEGKEFTLPGSVPPPRNDLMQTKFKIAYVTATSVILEGNGGGRLNNIVEVLNVRVTTSLWKVKHLESYTQPRILVEFFLCRISIVKSFDRRNVKIDISVFL